MGGGGGSTHGVPHRVGFTGEEGMECCCWGGGAAVRVEWSEQAEVHGGAPASRSLPQLKRSDPEDSVSVGSVPEVAPSSVLSVPCSLIALPKATVMDLSGLPL